MREIKLKKEKNRRREFSGTGANSVQGTADTLLGRIKQIMKGPSQEGNHIRADDIAQSFVAQMEAGNFAHLKEFIDREEGRIPISMAGPRGEPLKAYIALPVEGDDAP